MKLIGSPFIRKESFGNAGEEKEKREKELKNIKYLNPNPCFGINYGVTSNIVVWIMNLIPLIIIFLPPLMYFTKMPVDFFKKFPGTKNETLKPFSKTLINVVLSTLGTGVVLFFVTQGINNSVFRCELDYYKDKSGIIWTIRDVDGKKVEGGIKNNRGELTFSKKSNKEDDAGQKVMEKYQTTHEYLEGKLIDTPSDVVKIGFKHNPSNKIVFLNFYKSKK